MTPQPKGTLPPGQNDAPSPKRPTADETAERRARAWRLRHEYGMNTNMIAQALGCHRVTVSRMLKTVRRQLARVYTPGGRFDPAEVVATMLDRADRYGRLAMQTFQTTEDDRAKMRALLVALRADLQAVTLLQDVSLLPRDFGTLRLEAQRERFSAGEIRRLAEELRKRAPAVSDAADDIVPIGEKQFLYGDVIDAEANDETGD